MRNIKTVIALATTLLPGVAFGTVEPEDAAEAAPLVIKGKIVDAKTGEQIIGANIHIKGDTEHVAMTGLDGTFSLKLEAASSTSDAAPEASEPLTLVYSCLGYGTKEFVYVPTETAAEVSLELDEQATVLGEAVVMAYNPGRTESGARGIERLSANVVNVMSAKAIELSPDLTVANALGRMSGITLEKNSSGEGQYAILRGMDKRYNYTLVNGVKIPSPDNKNRYVPLDIFPAEMLDRLEVYKSLTADLEGDGIGGAVNLIMKDAPDRQLFTANFSLGYNDLYFDRSFASFSTGGIQSQSPNERYGTDYAVSMSDFTTKNLAVKQTKFVPDLSAGITYGNRFFDNKLGLIAAVSAQNNHRGKNSDIYYETGSSTYGSTTYRYISELQTRLGAHVKLDYAPTPQHKLAWYNGYLYLRSQQVRDARGEKEEAVRLRLNRQGIYSSILSGKHLFADDALEVDWRGVYSKATNKTPDNTEIHLTTGSTGLQTVSVNPAATRRWEHNDDRDIAGYADVNYRLDLNFGTLNIKGGGMYRDKQRSSFYNEYTFKSATEQRSLIRYQDWTNFDEISFEAPRYGNLSDPLNYDATERVGAAYVMGKLNAGKWELTAGLRAEHTEQGYHLIYPTEDVANEGTQRYWDFLPDFHAKYELHTNGNLRFSYARAINRPSFFEIVPYNIINEDYKERGNPDLEHTVADNFDLRYEWFPSSTEQLMAGVFYKRIKDPIEYGMETSGQDAYYTPENFGTANNFGVEIDVTKYFNRFGIKANYTYTHSRITTSKLIEEQNTDANAETTIVTHTISQSRPLSGQAAHVFNISLLYKDTKNGWDGQLAFNYTSERLCIVSTYYDNDSWQDGYPQLDASFEKRFGNSGWSLFAKANNLINLPVVQYIKKNSLNENLSNVERHDGGLLERKERTGRSFLIGVRFKL